MPILALADVQQRVEEAFVRCGTSRTTAHSVARALVLAEADGFKGHGLSRFGSYAAQVRTGKIDGTAEPTRNPVRPGLVRVDAAFGFAYPALDLSVETLADLAPAQGIACAAIHRSHHCGSAGLYAEALARRGLVALLFANTPAAMAPWGGRRAVFGTNPIAFACPVPGREPIVVDMALSKVARGNIMAAKKRGEPIPEGWAFDANGQPTQDADAALAGTMAPLGDAKGVALALMVELLAGGLTGANYAQEASSFLDAAGDPPGTGQLIIAMDPAAFGTDPARFAVLADAIEGQDGARLPGARRLTARQAAERDGIMVPDAILDELAA